MKKACFLSLLAKRAVFIAFGALIGVSFTFSLSSGPVWGATGCNESLIQTEKSLRKVYFALRYSDSNCHYDARTLSRYAARAYLAGRFAETLWATSLGLSRAGDDDIRLELLLYQGLAYVDLGRYEEAIVPLKKAGFPEKTPKDGLISQRAHMALIEAYFRKGKKSVDENVKYLVNSFYYRYPESPYKQLVQQWYRNETGA